MASPAGLGDAHAAVRASHEGCISQECDASERNAGALELEDGQEEQVLRLVDDFREGPCAQLHARWRALAVGPAAGGMPSIQTRPVASVIMSLNVVAFGRG